MLTRGSRLPAPRWLKIFTPPYAPHRSPRPSVFPGGTLTSASSWGASGKGASHKDVPMGLFGRQKDVLADDLATPGRAPLPRRMAVLHQACRFPGAIL
jgi:hypothetical protein